MKIEIINTGSELFFDQIVNSNLTFISNNLLTRGLFVSFQTTVPDDLLRQVEVIKTACRRSDTVIITGGLGPTADDLTRLAISRATGRSLFWNSQAEGSLVKFFKKLGRPISPANFSQVYLPRSARALPNRLGTAPGFWLKIRKKNIIALPGVPFELRPMFTGQVLPRLVRGRRPKQRPVEKKLRVFGITESALADQITDALSGLTDKLDIGITVGSGGVITVRLLVRSGPVLPARKIIQKAQSLLVKKLGVLIFGRADDLLEDAVGRLLLKKSLTVAVAESCTGGLVTHRLTNVPGISRCLKESIICYDNRAKIKRLNIPPRQLKKYGAVSPEVTRLMAKNVTRSQKTRVGLGISGIAGPGGGTAKKPVGLVYVALFFKGLMTVEKYNFRGPREIIKERAASMALNLLRLHLIDD